MPGEGLGHARSLETSLRASEQCRASAEGHAASALRTATPTTIIVTPANWTRASRSRNNAHAASAARAANCEPSTAVTAIPWRAPSAYDRNPATSHTPATATSGTARRDGALRGGDRRDDGDFADSEPAVFEEQPEHVPRTGRDDPPEGVGVEARRDSGGHHGRQGEGEPHQHHPAKCGGSADQGGGARRADGRSGPHRRGPQAAQDREHALLCPMPSRRDTRTVNLASLCTSREKHAALVASTGTSFAS